MAWVLFGTYYYNKLRYFTTSQKKYVADKAHNIGIYSILQQDTKCKMLDSIPVRVTITISRKCLNYGVCGIFVLVKIRFVRYLSAVLKILSARLHTPCFFSKNPKAPSIASDTLACAVWNIWE